jgi:hypothetical protein
LTDKGTKFKPNGAVAIRKIPFKKGEKTGRSLGKTRGFLKEKNGLF